MPNLDRCMFIKRLSLAVVLQRGFRARWQVRRTGITFAQGRVHVQTQLRTRRHMAPLPLARAGVRGLPRAVVLCQAEVPIPSRSCVVWSFNDDCTAAVIT